MSLRSSNDDPVCAATRRSRAASARLRKAHCAGFVRRSRAAAAASLAFASISRCSCNCLAASAAALSTLSRSACLDSWYSRPRRSRLSRIFSSSASQMPAHAMSQSVTHAVYATSCHVTPRHATSRHVTPGHATSRHATSRHVMPRHVMPRHATSCHVTSCHVTPRHATSCHVTPRHVMPCHAMLRDTSASKQYARPRNDHETARACGDSLVVRCRERARARERERERERERRERERDEREGKRRRGGMVPACSVVPVGNLDFTISSHCASATPSRKRATAAFCSTIWNRERDCEQYGNTTHIT